MAKARNTVNGVVGEERQTRADVGEGEVEERRDKSWVLNGLRKRRQSSWGI